MGNIKGLYFKLNMDNPRDKFIYTFFKKNSEFEKIDKISLLDKMITVYINIVWQEYNKENNKQ